MPDTQLALLRYFEVLDSGATDEALLLLAPNVEFLLSFPAGERRETGRDAMLDYLNGRRPGVRRRHLPLRFSKDRDVEFVYGAVLEDETKRTGHFLGTCRVDGNGLICAYQVRFEPDMTIVP